MRKKTNRFGSFHALKPVIHLIKDLIYLNKLITSALDCLYFSMSSILYLTEHLLSPPPDYASLNTLNVKITNFSTMWIYASMIQIK